MIPDRGYSTFDSPAVYQIRVEGRLDTSWSDRLEGMAIRPIVPAAGPVNTILEGELHDQAALAGVLNCLYNLHLPVLAVERLAEHNQGEGK